jgi:hypothetical protein
MQSRYPDLLTAARQHIADTLCRQDTPPFLRQPELRCIRPLLRVTKPQIPAHCLSSLQAERHDTNAGAFAHNKIFRSSIDTSVFIKPAISARRQPVSTNNRMIAVSRRGTKSFPSQVARSARSWSSVRTGTGVSGTCGGRMRFIGEWLISSSRTIQPKNCWRAR